MDRPPPEELLKHAGFLRALAYRLVGDDARADDLVQEAYVAALERPPKGSVRAWLGAVVRNLAGKLRRSEGRREGREHAAARPEPLPPADDVAARIALHRQLVQAVEKLEEPYRTAIVLRFFYDLKPAEVAERLGVPVETVRTRTRRALDLLRGRIDRGALLLALLPLHAPGPSALPWGILMAVKRRIVFALLLLLLMTGGMLVVARRELAETPRAPEAPDRRAAASSSAAADSETTAPPSREEIEILRGLVLLDGAPVEGAHVALRDRPPTPPLFDVTTQAFRQLTAPLPKALDEALTDSLGRFTLRSSRRAAYMIEAVADGAVPARVLAYVPLTEDVTIRLARGETLGRVVDEAGAPVARASVRWRGGTYVRGETFTDAEGRFRIPGGDVWIHVSAAGYAPATAGEEGASGIVLRRGGLVTGVVRERGTPVEGATVLLVTGSVPAETRTDAAGRYELRLPEGHLVHAMVLAPGRPAFGSWTGELALPPRPVAAARELTFDIALPAGMLLSGTVAEGEMPVEGAAVVLCRLRALWPVAVAATRSDARGAFAFDAVPAGPYEVRAAAPGLFGKAGTTVPEGSETPSVTVAVKKAGRVEGKVAGELPVGQVGLEFSVPPAGYFDVVVMRQADVDALGRFVFEPVEPAEGVRVRATTAYIRSEPFSVVGGETARVTLDTSAARILRGRVVDARGAPVAGALVAAVQQYDGYVGLMTLREIGAATGPDGRFAVALPEREFSVVAYHEDAAPSVSESVDPSRELEVVLQPGLALSGRIVWPGGAPARDVQLRVEGGTSAGVGDRSWQRVPNGEFELRARSAGTVAIEVRHPDGVAPTAWLEAGTRDAVIELKRTLSIRGAVIDARDRPVSAARVTAKARGKKDAVAHSTQQGRFEIQGLDDGTYDLHLEPGTQSDWHPPTLVPFVPTVVASVAAGTADVVVQVDGGREAAGVVLGPDGAPVAGAFVAALGRSKGLAPTTRTGTDGRFRLSGLTNEHDEVLVSASGFPPRAAALADEMAIRLEAGERIRLRFLAPDDKPLAGQWVYASVTTPAIVERVKVWRERLMKTQGAGWLEGGRAQTDADGRAEIKGLAPGEYGVSSFRAAGGVSPALVVRTGEAERTVQLEAACSISGRVVGRDGNPCGSVKGEYWINVAAYRGEAQLGYVATKEDGSFEIEGLTRGPVRLVIDYSGPVPAFEGEAAAEAPARDVRIVATR